MILAIALLLGAGMLAWSAPVGLRRISSAAADPGAAITCWVVCIASVLGTFAAGVGLLLVPGDHLARGVASCWTALRHGGLPELDETIGAVGLAVLLVVAVRFVLAAGRRLRSVRRAHRAHVDLLRVTGGCSGRQRTLWLEHGQPLAYSIAGRPAWWWPARAYTGCLLIRSPR